MQSTRPDEIEDAPPKPAKQKKSVGKGKRKGKGRGELYRRHSYPKLTICFYGKASVRNVMGPPDSFQESGSGSLDVVGTHSSSSVLAIGPQASTSNAIPQANGGTDTSQQSVTRRSSRLSNKDKSAKSDGK